MSTTVINGVIVARTEHHDLVEDAAAVAQAAQAYIDREAAEAVYDFADADTARRFRIFLASIRFQVAGPRKVTGTAVLSLAGPWGYVVAEALDSAAGHVLDDDTDATIEGWTLTW